MRIAIFGAGGLGGYYGARLQQAGNQVGFIARGAHLAAIREQGLRILSPLGDAHLQDLHISDDPADIGPVDAVIVAVKTWQIPEVARALSPLLGEQTVVVPFLNGVEASDGLAAVIGEGCVVGGLSKVFAMVESPGVIRHFHTEAHVEMGELDGGVSDRIHALCRVFEGAGVGSSASGDIRSALWKKLLMVASWSGLGALARSPMGTMRGDPQIRALVEQSMDEGIAVGQARGHAVDTTFKDELWAFYEAMPETATSSMMRDILAGRPSELDAWNGAIVRFGLEMNVATPVQHMTYALLRPMEERARAAVG